MMTDRVEVMVVGPYHKILHICPTCGVAVTDRGKFWLCNFCETTYDKTEAAE